MLGTSSQNSSTEFTLSASAQHALLQYSEDEPEAQGEGESRSHRNPTLFQSGMPAAHSPCELSTEAMSKASTRPTSLLLHHLLGGLLMLTDEDRNSSGSLSLSATLPRTTNTERPSFKRSLSAPAGKLTPKKVTKRRRMMRRNSFVIPKKQENANDAGGSSTANQKMILDATRLAKTYYNDLVEHEE
jgi:hypothetical protein